MQGLGNVIDESTPFVFVFRAAIKVPIALHDYVVVDIDEPTGDDVKAVKVLGEVVGMGSKNPAITEKLVGAPMQIYSYKLVRVEILGYMEDGVIRHPKAAPDPGAVVYKADDQTLQTYFGGVEKDLPIYVGTLMNRPGVRVPIHLQGLQFHTAILGATRSGKSFLSGAVVEQILIEGFAVVVIDMHADYVHLDKLSSGEKHNKFRSTVYYPSGAPQIDGVTADTKELALSFGNMPIDGIVELLGQTIGERQIIVFKRIIRELKEGNTPFGIEDVISKVRERLEEQNKEDGTFVLRGDDRSRYEGLLDRLEDLESDIKLSPTGVSMSDIIQPGKLSVICLNGVQSRLQDATTSILVDQIFRYLVSIRGKSEEVPTFLFIEEAHRVASPKASAYSVKAISTAIREGAKFGLFMGLISQRPRSIDSDVLANVGNFAVLRITNPEDQRMIEAAGESFSKRLTEDLPSLNQGEVVLVGPWVPLPAHIKTLPRITKHGGITPNLREKQKHLNEFKEKRSAAKW